MGTRGKLQVINEEGKLVVNQLGAYDNNPTLAGAELIGILNNAERVENLKENLKKCRFATSDEVELFRLEDNRFFNYIMDQIDNEEPVKSVNEEMQSSFDTYKEQWVHLWYNGSKAMDCLLVLSSNDTSKVELNSEIILYNDSCEDWEWLYIVDFKENELRIVYNLNKVVKWSLNKLPIPSVLEKLEIKASEE